MARKNTVLDSLVTLPWWFNLILAVVTYFSIKHLLPTVKFESTALKMLVDITPNMAGMFAAVFIFVAAISALHSWRKGELLKKQTSVKSIQNLSWKDFEYLISEAFKRKGFSVVENSSSGSDGGIDLILSKDSEKILVQCKNWKSNKVGVTIIRELLGVVTAEGASRGIVVCSGSYTKDAVNFASNNNIELIGGNNLARLISSVQNKQQRHVKSENTYCPVCGSHMIHRVAKKGKNVGTSFMGCSTYPKCRGTRKY